MRTLAAVGVALAAAAGCVSPGAAGRSEPAPVSSEIPETMESDMMMKALTPFSGTRWSGTGELWLDGLGDTADTGPCSMSFEPSAIRYTWDYKGKMHRGVIELGKDVRWSDTFHLPKGSVLRKVPGAWGLLALAFEYKAESGPDWGWRIGLCQRPDGALVMQMTNITPWGEEGRAVRMTMTKTP